MNAREVCITGIGPVASVGTGCDAFWTALVEGHSHIEDRSLVIDLDQSVDLPIAGMKPPEDLPDMAHHLSSLEPHHLEAQRDAAYSLRAIELAFEDAGLHPAEPDNHIGMVQAYEAPGVESAVRGMYQMMGNTGNSSERPRIYEHLAQSFYNMQPFLYVHALAKAFGLRGFCTSVHNACASAAFAIDTAARQIQSNHADVMVVVGGEAFDTAVRLEWFRTLSLYAADHRMRPFDGDPSGFYVGEGGIAFILESFEHAAARNADIYATYGGSEFRHQAWKQTLPDLRSQRLAGCVTSALEKQGLGPDAVDLVLPHAACTSLSDSYESQAVQSALGKETDAVAAAYKPHVGHMLAASGLMELAAGLLAMKNGTVPGTLHSQPERTVGTIPLAVSTMDKDVQVLLKLSTGFTGHDGASIYRRFTGLS